VDSGSASFVCSDFLFQSPQGIDNSERSGAAGDYKSFDIAKDRQSGGSDVFQWTGFQQK
jgi:hypothetical protein